MSVFQTFGRPVLAGLSRKSFLYKPLGITPEEALPATMAANFIALRNGADILRVHDVKEARETVRLYGLYMG
jgi:dihydropteroate synthase